MKSSRISSLAVVVFLVTGLAGGAQAYILGYTQLNNFTATPSAGLTGGVGGMQGTDFATYSGSAPPSGGSLPAETSATWTFGSAQTVGSVFLFPNSTPNNNQPYHYQLYTNGVLAVDQTWAAEATTEYRTKPQVLNAGWTGVTSLKYQQLSVTRTNVGFDEIRDLSSMVVLSQRVDKLISPNSATSSVGWNNLGITYDGVKNATPAITTLAAPTNDAWITYSFSTPKRLSGLLVDLNNIDSTAPFSWYTWKVYDAPGGNLLINNPVGNSNENYQVLMFPGGPLTLSSFTLEGPMNNDFGSSGRGRLGEVFGILDVPEPSVVLLSVVGGVLVWRRRSRPV